VTEVVARTKGPFSFSDIATELPLFARDVIVACVRILADHGKIERETLVLWRRVKYARLRKGAAGP
jgi:hypothetical protein